MEFKASKQKTTNITLKQLQMKLSNITEVTEQCSRHLQSDKEKDNDRLLKKTAKEENKCIKVLDKYFYCFKIFYQSLFARMVSNQIFVNQSQMSQIISRLKQRKPKIFLLPEQADKKKKTLVLDLDETLVHSSLKKPKYIDFELDFQVDSKKVKIYIQKRFGVESFLFDLSKIYEIIIFSSGKRNYVEQVLTRIDPKKRISFILSRQHCTIINKYYYIKHLNALGRDLKNIILVDDNKMAGIMNQQNFYQIKPFKGNQKDRNLIKLSYFLHYIHEIQDVKPVQYHRKKFEAQQIDIHQNKKYRYLSSLKSGRQASDNQTNSNICEQTGINLGKQQS